MKLGTEKKPAVVRVQTAERAQEILRFCESHGWKVILGVEPEKPEDLTDIERLSNPLEPAVRKAFSVGRNDPCPCGSSKKFKKCCIGKE